MSATTRCRLLAFVGASERTLGVVGSSPIISTTATQVSGPEQRGGLDQLVQGSGDGLIPAGHHLPACGAGKTSPSGHPPHRSVEGRSHNHA